MYKKYEIIPAKGIKHMKALAVATIAICTAQAGAVVGQASAESLNEALIQAYLKNPSLNAQRAQLRATDEGVALAKSGFRPTVGLNATYTHTDLNITGVTKTGSWTVQLRQPVFRGLRTINTLRQTEAEVLAAREDLRDVEQGIFLQTVTAYVDVVRDKAIVRLRQNNVRVLTKQLRATKDRFQVGEVTKTDVAQANARRSGAVSQLSVARSNLASSRATYQRLVGKLPKRLRAPGGIEKYIPKSQNVALEIGTSEHPRILAANYREQSAKHAIRVVAGELLPELTFETEYTRVRSDSDLSGVIHAETTTLRGQASVPVYQGGSVSSRVRQAKQTRVQRQEQIREQRIAIKAEIIAAWGQWNAARAQLTSQRAQVSASRTALNGVREEEKVGQRTVLDVLDAEQEFLDAQVALSTTKRDYTVAGYTVLSSIGRLGASDLNLSVPLYDAKRYYDKVKGKWFGFGKTNYKSANRK